MKKYLGVTFIIFLFSACGGGGSSGGSEILGNPSVAANSAPYTGGLCPDGGITVETGIDDNGNGVLDTSEVDDTQIVCNGADGATGATGTDGVDGATGSDGLTTLIVISTESAGANCASGGKKIEVGLDDNGDTVLDAGEVDDTQYLCTGEAIASDGTISAPVAVDLAAGSVAGYVNGADYAYYTFDSDSAGIYVMALTATASDLSWEVYSDQRQTNLVADCDTAIFTGAADESCSADLSAATTYYLLVKEWEGVAGSFTMSLSVPVAYVSLDVPVAITDSSTVTSTIDIADTGTIYDVNVGLDITHTWNSDLDIFLISPAGTRIELSTDNSGANYTSTIFDDEAGTLITAGSAPFTGSFVPEAVLFTLDGESITGTWTLEITDDMGGDTGTLDAWNLEITSN